MIKHTGVFYISGSNSIDKPTKRMQLKYGKKELMLFIPLVKQRAIIPWTRIQDVRSYHEVVDKNVSVGKAVVGGAVLGPVGAVLGGLMGTEGVKSSLFITYLDENDEQQVLVISHKWQIEQIKKNINKKVQEAQNKL